MGTLVQHRVAVIRSSHPWAVCAGWGCSRQPEVNPSLHRVNPKFSQWLPRHSSSQLSLMAEGRNESRRHIHVLIRGHRFQVFFSDCSLQPTETAFSPTISFAFPRNFLVFHQSFLLSFLWKWRLTKETLCNMDLQAVIEQEADAKSCPSLGRDSGNVGKSNSWKASLSPTDW